MSRNKYLVISFIDVPERTLSDQINNILGVFYSKTESKHLNVYLYNLLEPNLSFFIDLSHITSYHNLSFENTNAEFICTNVADIDNDNVEELVVALSFTDGKCILGYFKFINKSPIYFPIKYFNAQHISLIRSIAIGDIHGNDKNDIYIGTRPNGIIIHLTHNKFKWISNTITKDAFGNKNTNVRELAIVKLQESTILCATISSATPSSKVFENERYKKWESTPGAIYAFSLSNNKWSTRIIDNFGGITHSRMLKVADIDNDGINEIISTSVGVLRNIDLIDPKPIISYYKEFNNIFHKFPIIELGNAIKSRAACLTHFYNNNTPELVLSTRHHDINGSTNIILYTKNKNNEWIMKEIIDSSGELGFHEMIYFNSNQNGKHLLVASDDGEGLIKIYERKYNLWQTKIALKWPNSIYVSKINRIDI